MVNFQLQDDQDYLANHELVMTANEKVQDKTESLLQTKLISLGTNLSLWVQCETMTQC